MGVCVAREQVSTKLACGSLRGIKLATKSWYRRSETSRRKKASTCQCSTMWINPSAPRSRMAVKSSFDLYGRSYVLSLIILQLRDSGEFLREKAFAIGYVFGTTFFDFFLF